MSNLADSVAYQAALEAAGLKPEDRIGIAYRATPLMPLMGEDGMPQLIRKRTLVRLVKLQEGHIIYRHDNGTITVEPLSELFVEMPSEEAIDGPRITPVRGGLVHP